MDILYTNIRNTLVRVILAKVEEHEGGNRPLSLSTGQFVEEFPGLKSAILDDHIKLLEEASFVEAAPHQFGWLIVGLTWAGHDFLANSKCPTIWERAKQVGSHLAFDIFASVLKEAALKSVKNML